MDFSSLVIMEKDKENGVIKGELGSYSVLEGTNFVKKLYCVDGEVSLFFDTDKDVLEWEFSAIYDLFNVEALTSLGYIVEEFDEEYNPKFNSITIWRDGIARGIYNPECLGNYPITYDYYHPFYEELVDANRK